MINGTKSSQIHAGKNGLLASKAEPDLELKTPTHYKSRWQGIPGRIGLEHVDDRHARS
jgi:hypothetical protein